MGLREYSELLEMVQETELDQRIADRFRQERERIAVWALSDD